MLHELQTMHCLPKVFVVKVEFQRKPNAFRNENIQLKLVNSLKSTLQWHLEGKTLKINNQNMHFKSVLKKQELQDYLDRQLPGFLEQTKTTQGFITSFLPNSFLLSLITSTLLLNTSQPSRDSFSFPFSFPLKEIQEVSYDFQIKFWINTNFCSYYFCIWKRSSNKNLHFFWKRQPLIPCVIRNNCWAFWRPRKSPQVMWANQRLVLLTSSYKRFLQLWHRNGSWDVFLEAANI